MQLTLTQKLWLPTVGLAVVVVAMSTLSVVRTRALLAESATQQAAREEKLELSLRWAGLTEANATRVVASLVSGDPQVSAALKPQMEA
ncbi:MAG: hypothetical protein IIZ92_04625, partial [Aquincola sp.]|nr:hypothetical protein [Aquincola sp.]